MQSHLRSLFAGKREAVELPAKRGPGRPPKVRKKEEETVRWIVCQCFG
jgi:transposase